MTSVGTSLASLWPDDLHRYGYRTVNLNPTELSGLLEFHTGLPGPLLETGVFLTPDILNGAEARSDLALTYEPGCRMKWMPSTLPSRGLFSLYGRQGAYNRAWPAYGKPGGGHEILLDRVPPIGALVDIGPARRGNYGGNSYFSDFLGLTTGRANSRALSGITDGLLLGLGIDMGKQAFPAFPDRPIDEPPPRHDRGERRPDDKESVTVRVDDNGVVIGWALGQPIRYAISAGLRRGGNRFRLWASAWSDDESEGLRRLWGALSIGELPAAWSSSTSHRRRTAMIAEALKISLEELVGGQDGRHLRLPPAMTPLDTGT